MTLKSIQEETLMIHPDKCEILVIAKKEFICPLPAITLCDNQIKVVQHSNCLRATIDSNLSWDAHVKNAFSNFSAKVNKLYRMRRISKQTLSTIYFQGTVFTSRPTITFQNCPKKRLKRNSTPKCF